VATGEGLAPDSLAPDLARVGAERERAAYEGCGGAQVGLYQNNRLLIQGLCIKGALCA